MAEVIHVFDEPIFLNGNPYVAQVAGRANGHIWEGWIEFAAEDGSDTRRTPRETTQPDRAALVYWAAGLSGTYLEGAMARALDPAPRRGTSAPAALALFDDPAPPPVAPFAPTPPIATERAILDPYSVGAKGADLLRNELGALDEWHLKNIIRAYRLADIAEDLDAFDKLSLIDLIVTAVQAT
jgi:hypothetical protein